MERHPSEIIDFLTRQVRAYAKKGKRSDTSAVFVFPLLVRQWCNEVTVRDLETDIVISGPAFIEVDDRNGDGIVRFFWSVREEFADNSIEDTRLFPQLDRYLITVNGDDND